MEELDTSFSIRRYSVKHSYALSPSNNCNQNAELAMLICKFSFVIIRFPVSTLQLRQHDCTYSKHRQGRIKQNQEEFNSTSTGHMDGELIVLCSPTQNTCNPSQTIFTFAKSSLSNLYCLQHNRRTYSNKFCSLSVPFTEAVCNYESSFQIFNLYSLLHLYLKQNIFFHSFTVSKNRHLK